LLHNLDIQSSATAPDDLSAPVLLGGIGCHKELVLHRCNMMSKERVCNLQRPA
jgi:hypothetical protein